MRAIPTPTPRKYGLKRTSIFSERWKGRVRGTRDAIEITLPPADGLDGSGTEGTIPVWTDTETLGDSRIVTEAELGHVSIPGSVDDDRALLHVGGIEDEDIDTDNDMILAIAHDGNGGTFVSTGDGQSAVFRSTSTTKTAPTVVFENAGKGADIELASRIKQSYATIVAGVALSPRITLLFYNAAAGPFTVELPAASEYTGSILRTHNTANSAVTITFARKTGTTDTINGGGLVAATSATVNTAFGVRDWTSDGTKWYVR